MLQLEFIAHRLKSTSPWRATMAMRYPHDPRNALARDRLAELAKEPLDSVTEETQAKLKGLSGPEFASAVQLAAREVCFKYEPSSLEDVALRVIQTLTPNSDRFAAVLGGAR